MWLPKSIDEVWSKLTHTDTLLKISPPHLKVSLGEGAETREGAQFRIQFSFPVLPFIRGGWTVRVTKVEDTGAKRVFVDEQMGGPFKLWRHEHIFESDIEEIQGQTSKNPIKSKGPGTWVRDRVEYALPLGIWGLAAQKIFIQNELNKMFAFRRKKTQELFDL